MVKCEKCGNVQPGDSLDICRRRVGKTNCGFICHPIKSVRSSSKPPKEIPEEIERRTTFGEDE